MNERTHRTTLLTGLPSSFVARRLLLKILTDEPNTQVKCLVPRKFMEQAATLLDLLPAHQLRRVEVVRGDTAAMDFGLSGTRFLELAESVDVIHHCAAVSYPGVDREVAERVNVGGASEVLELAETSERAQLLVHWSTSMVSGKRTGRVGESELLRPPGFHNVVEETRYRAESVIREAMDRVPTIIMRPSIIVGDSKTGEVDKMQGPYLLILLMLNSPVDMRVPLPGRGDVPLNLVPIDYVIDAGHAISQNPRSVGRTFHLVDENPPTARRVFERIAEATGKRSPVANLPTPLTTALLRTPGLNKLSQVPRAFLEQLATDVAYDCRNTREVLASTGIACPKPASYLPVMVEHVREQQRTRSKRASTPPDETYDPLS